MPLFCLVAAWPKVKGDSVACWQLYLVQFMSLSFLVAVRPEVIQKHIYTHVSFVYMFRFVSVSKFKFILLLFITLSSACTDLQPTCSSKAAIRIFANHAVFSSEALLFWLEGDSDARQTQRRLIKS